MPGKEKLQSQCFYFSFIHYNNTEILIFIKKKLLRRKYFNVNGVFFKNERFCLQIHFQY